VRYLKLDYLTTAEVNEKTQEVGPLKTNKQTNTLSENTSPVAYIFLLL
jgi:hypothetical protein